MKGPPTHGRPQKASAFRCSPTPSRMPDSARILRHPSQRHWAPGTKTGAQNDEEDLPASPGDERRHYVGGVAVEGDPRVVVTHGRPRVRVGRSLLDVAQRHAGVQSGVMNACRSVWGPTACRCRPGEPPGARCGRLRGGPNAGRWRLRRAGRPPARRWPGRRPWPYGARAGRSPPCRLCAAR